MINTETFYTWFGNHGIEFFSGVPDSLLKDICAYITDNTPKSKHIIAANEGNAVGLASGYHLATGKIPLVYMQNSGMGNAVNPLLSLTDKKVYNVPVLLMIGWRGEPGVKDEPQHVTQGAVTTDLLEAMKIPYVILDHQEDAAELQFREAMETIKKNNQPFALLVKKGTFSKYKIKKEISNEYTLSREAAIKRIIDQLNGDEVIVSTTGKTSRELFEYREQLNQHHKNDFLTVGSMGHSSQIALGIALNRPEKKIICIDGDGALLMHAGGMSVIGGESPENYLHIVINNGAHESVGGQPTVGFLLDIPAIAMANNYKKAISVSTVSELDQALKELRLYSPALLEIKVRVGSRDDLGRPTIKPVDNKIDFMKNLND